MDDRAFDRLLRVARHLPGDALAALEIRVSPDPADLPDTTETPVDLSVRLETPDQARAVARQLPPSHIPSLLMDWADGLPALRPVHSLWLEFDLHRDPGDELPQPVVCARLRPGPHRRDTAWLLEEMFPRLHGPDLTAAQREWIRRGIEAVPPTCGLLYAFTLGARPGRAVRLEVYGEDLDDLLGYLEAVSPVLRRTTEPRRDRFREVDRCHVSFDIRADGLGPRVGVEGSFRRTPRREPRWADWLSRMAVPDPQLILTWSGIQQCEGFEILRAVSHLKTSYRPVPPSETKLYLLALRRPR